jgi:hypothetical protein
MCCLYNCRPYHLFNFFVCYDGQKTRGRLQAGGSKLVFFPFKLPPSCSCHQIHFTMNIVKLPPKERNAKGAYFEVAICKLRHINVLIFQFLLKDAIFFEKKLKVGCTVFGGLPDVIGC